MLLSNEKTIRIISISIGMSIIPSYKILNFEKWIFKKNQIGKIKKRKKGHTNAMDVKSTKNWYRYC